jgi:UDP-glucose 4-epimerase
VTTTLVTGAAGFIGSHLCDELLRRGDTVVGLDYLSTGRMKNLDLALESARFHFIEGSTTHQPVMERAVGRVDRVAHLAAPVGVARVMSSPLETFEKSVIGALVVTQVAATLTKPLLLTSSSEIYGKSEDLPLTEDCDRLLGSPQSPRWTYSTAKACAEILTLGRCAAAGVPAVVARLFNVVGPRQVGDYGMVLPRFVRAALSGDSLLVFGDGSQTRTFLDVNDVVEALVGLMESPEADGQVFNVGSQHEIAIKDLARRVVTACRSASDIEFVPYPRHYGAGFEDPPRRVPSTERLTRTIGWRPRSGLDEVIGRIAAEAAGPSH